MWVREVRLSCFTEHRTGDEAGLFGGQSATTMGHGVGLDADGLGRLAGIAAVINCRDPDIVRVPECASLV